MNSMNKECEFGVFNYCFPEIDITAIINYLETYAMHKNYSLGKKVQVVIDNIDDNCFINLKTAYRNKIFNDGLTVIRGCTCYKLLHDFIDYNEEDYKDKEQYLAFYDKFFLIQCQNDKIYKNRYIILDKIVPVYVSTIYIFFIFSPL